MSRRIFRYRYEVRSVSGTAWWRTNDMKKALAILKSHGERLDYVYDTETGGQHRQGLNPASGVTR